MATNLALPARLTPTQRQILVELVVSGGRITVGDGGSNHEVARLLGTRHPETVRTNLRRLERARLVRRSAGSVELTVPLDTVRRTLGA